MKYKILHIILPPLIILLLHFVLYYGLNIYGYFSWFDIPMHALGGSAIALSSYFFLTQAKQNRLFQSMHWQLYVLIIISFTLSAAVFWEWAEFLGDLYINHASFFQPSTADTMTDLFCGFVGGFITILFLLPKIKKDAAT